MFDWMIYPLFEFGDGRIIPTIKLPRDYKNLVPLFYEQGRKQEVIDYVNDLNKHLKWCGLEKEVNTDTDLEWDENKGLILIRIRPSGGLDLNEREWPNFQEHNLGGKASFVAGAIAMKYVSELMKSRTH